MKTPKQIDRDRERELKHCQQVAREIQNAGALSEDYLTAIIQRERRSIAEKILRDFDDDMKRPEYRSD